MSSIPSEVEPHDMKTCPLCQSPAMRSSLAAEGEVNMKAIHHTLETMVANGYLRKVMKNGEVAYTQVEKQ